MPDERAAIEATGAFSNIDGIETKYFSRTLEGARTFARMATVAFGDGPFSIVRTRIRTSLIAHDMRVTVDGNIETIVVPTHLLDCLGPPVIVSSRHD